MSEYTFGTPDGIDEQEIAEMDAAENSVWSSMAPTPVEEEQTNETSQPQAEVSYG